MVAGLSPCCCCCLSVCALFFSLLRGVGTIHVLSELSIKHMPLCCFFTHTHTQRRQIQRQRDMLHFCQVTSSPEEIGFKNQKIWNRMNLNGPQIERIIRGQSVLGIPLTQIAQQEVTSPISTSSKKKKGGWRHFASGAVRRRPRRN